MSPCPTGEGGARACVRVPVSARWGFPHCFNPSVPAPSYPLEPPRVRFATPIHHPNVDAGGRICLDTLSLPPKGAWRPSLNVATVLASVRLLLATPNGDDGVDDGVCHQYRHDRAAFDERARAMTAAHATGRRQEGGDGGGEPDRPPLVPVQPAAGPAAAAAAAPAERLQLKRPRSGD